MAESINIAVARVVVDRSADCVFDYAIPESLRPALGVGSRVRVPLGKAEVSGYVIGLANSSSFPVLKPILAVDSEKSLLSATIVRLAEWMADYYCAPIENAVRAVLPGAVRRRDAGFRKQRYLRLIEGGAAPDLTPKQRAIVTCLEQHGSEMFAGELLALTGASLSVLKTLEKRGRLRVTEETVARSPFSERAILATQPLPLSEEQRAAVDRANRTIDAGLAARECGSGRAAPPHVVLLRGVTGSGKTEVYLQCIAHAISKGAQAIVLVPEIALTPQTVNRFRSRFGERIAVLHSHLSEGERHDEWHRIRDGDAAIVIGARSAVFAPLPRLGLIVVDEEHEPGYKQAEAPPYNARDVAVMRGLMEPCAVLLGSATPSLESWHNVKKGKYALCVLSHRADGALMPSVRIVDMRIETQKTGKPSVFSSDLLEAIRLRLERGEQTMLFLNRRGYASSLSCPLCGYVVECPQCSIAFTYHRTDERLHCHICGADDSLPALCPGCRSPDIRYGGIGTQRVETILRALFPKAGIQRMDGDVTTRKDAYERILGDFRSGRTDILIGTQMIAKGLHFPNVTLVGVILADLSLNIPDFRAAERTFQLLAQVAGRAGRGGMPGTVIIQTFKPGAPPVAAAVNEAFEPFAESELGERASLLYPPISRLVVVTFRGRNEERVRNAAECVAARLEAAFDPARVLFSGAGPAPLARAKGLFRYQMVMRARHSRDMIMPLREALRKRGWGRDVAYSVDVDALNMT